MHVSTVSVLDVGFCLVKVGSVAAGGGVVVVVDVEVVVGVCLSSIGVMVIALTLL